MKSKKILALVIPALLFAGGIVGCGNEKDSKEESSNDIVYLEEVVDDISDGKINITALKDGKEINLGECKTGFRTYDEEKEVYVVVKYDCSENKQKLVEIDSKGNEKVLLEDEFMAGCSYSNAGYFYYINKDSALTRVNLKDKSKVELFKGEYASLILQEVEFVNGYYIYGTEDNYMAIKEGTDEVLKLGEARGGFTRSGDIIATSTENNEIMYLDTSNGKITLDKVEGEIDPYVVGVQGDTVVYYGLEEVLEKKITMLNKKSIGGKSEKIASIETSGDYANKNYITFSEKEGDKTFTKYIDKSDEKFEVKVLCEGEGYNLKNIDGKLYYSVNNIIYERDGESAKELFKLKGNQFVMFEQNNKLGIMETVAIMKNQNQSRSASYNIHLGGEMIAQGAIWATKSGDDIIFKDKDGKFNKLVDGKVESLNVDEKYDIVSNKDDNKAIFDLWEAEVQDYRQDFNEKTIEGYWKGIENDTEVYYCMDGVNLREFRVNSEGQMLNYFELFNSTSLDEIKGEELEKDKFKLEQENTRDGEKTDIIVEKINDNEIKFGEKVLKRIPKAESDVVMKKYMENSLAEGIIRDQFKTSTVKLEKVDTLESVNYYIVVANNNEEEKYVVREDGNIFSYERYEKNKEKLNQEVGNIKGWAKYLNN
ncbi:MAG: hypothetical protein ACRCWG_11325 [Sarcina sp.]